MNRRTAIVSCLTILFSLCGCSTRSDRLVPVESETAHSPTVIVAKVFNETTRQQTVEVVLAADGETIVEERTDVAPAEAEVVDLGIAERGAYVLTVEVHDGPKYSYFFTVEDRHLRDGSNIHITVLEEALEITLEQ